MIAKASHSTRPTSGESAPDNGMIEGTPRFVAGGDAHRQRLTEGAIARVGRDHQERRHADPVTEIDQVDPTSQQRLGH
jgi:hypothetical protein